MTQKIVSFFIMGLVALIIGTDVFFTVDQREKVLVLQFGEAVAYHESPGLKMKIPYIQTLTRYDSRLLGFNLPALEVTAGDQKRVVVDLFIRYRIKDTLLFYRKIRTNHEAQNRLSTIVDASMRQVIGRIPLAHMLSEKRKATMASILQEVSTFAKDLGIDVEDVRIISFDLPKENREAIFQRMETERRQEAKQFRAEGEQRAQEIRADADREKTIIVARAERDAQIKQGQGDGEASQIYADAYNQDADFFSFYRSLEAYRESFKDQTSFVLNKESSFFKYINE